MFDSRIPEQFALIAQCKYSIMFSDNQNLPSKPAPLIHCNQAAKHAEHGYKQRAQRGAGRRGSWCSLAGPAEIAAGFVVVLFCF